MALPRAASSETRHFLVALGDEARTAPADEDLHHLVGRVLTQVKADRGVTVAVLASLARSDAALVLLEEVLSNALAASQIPDIMAGEPRVHDDAGELDDLWRVYRVQGEARHAVFAAFDMLSSAGVASALGVEAKNREAARTLRGRGEVIGLPHKNGYVYPAFQFDVDRRRVWPAVARVNLMLDARHDPWGVAGWWLGRRRGDDTPRWQLVADQNREADLVAAAEAVLEPIG